MSQTSPETESDTAEGRLADIIENEKPTLWLGRYRLSDHDRDAVFSALRAAARTSVLAQPRQPPPEIETLIAALQVASIEYPNSHDELVVISVAMRDRLVAALSAGHAQCSKEQREVEQLRMQVAGTKAGRDFHIGTAAELLALLTGIIDAESEFREAIGSNWEGDPLSDAIDAARRFVNLETVSDTSTDCEGK